MIEDDKIDIVAAIAWILSHSKNTEATPLEMLGLASVALRAVNEERARLLEEPIRRQ